MTVITLILLLAWQAFARSAGFALGWATAAFFGEIPGNKGRVLSIVAVMSVAWVLVLFGTAVPIIWSELSERSVSVAASSVPPAPVDVQRAQRGLGLAAIAVLPPLATLVAEVGGLGGPASPARWIRGLASSYAVTASLGLAVVQMAAITPIVALRRRRERRVMRPIALVARAGEFEGLVGDVEHLLARIGPVPVREPLDGMLAWPLRTVGFASERLLRGVERETPVRLRAGDLEVLVHVTNIIVIAPVNEAASVRAAVLKELAFTRVYLTWSEESQRFEDELMGLCGDEAPTAVDALVGALDALQARIDAADLKEDEWQVLYRLRLQIERDALRRAAPVAQAG